MEPDLTSHPKAKSPQKPAQTGTKTPGLEVFLIELREQCMQCATALAELEQVVKYPPPSDNPGRQFWNRRVWLRVHALLSASSAVSHILWPNPSPRRGPDAVKRTNKRASELRSFLGIKSHSPLTARKVRNAFEHIDERLDDWLPTVSLDIPLGWSVSTLEPDDEDPIAKDAFRYLHVNSMDLRVAGETCNLEEIVDWTNGIVAAIPVQAQMIYRKQGEPEVLD